MRRCNPPSASPYWIGTLPGDKVALVICTCNEGGRRSFFAGRTEAEVTEIIKEWVHKWAYRDFLI